MPFSPALPFSPFSLNGGGALRSSAEKGRKGQDGQAGGSGKSILIKRIFNTTTIFSSYNI